MSYSPEIKYTAAVSITGKAVRIFHSFPHGFSIYRFQYLGIYFSLNRLMAKLSVSPLM